MSDRHVLRWTLNNNSPPVLPSHIIRIFILSPSGLLELLIAQPPPSEAPRKRALFFQHGGFGCASMWIPFLTYFSQTNGHPCYALSLRGHGESWKPSILRMLFLVGKHDFALDLMHGLNWAKAYEAGMRGRLDGYDDIALIGHSAGGGLSQYLLGEGMGKVGALCVMGAYPPFNGVKIYQLWGKLDPWVYARMFFRDFFHPRSPLSSTTLVHRAFFCPSFPKERVKQFEGLLSEIESLRWPIGMIRRFVNVPGVVRNILGWGLGTSQRVLVVAGEKDTLIGTELPALTANAYRVARRAMIQCDSTGGKAIDVVNDGDGSREQCDGVRFVVINGSGHHIQNDLQWEYAAAEILSFISQL